MKTLPDTSSFHFHNANPKNRRTGDCVVQSKGETNMMKMTGIEKKDLVLFEDEAGRRKLMEKYGDSPTDFIGHNDDDEMVLTAIYFDKIIVTTYQKNHWIREDWYNADGEYESEMYKGRWE